MTKCEFDRAIALLNQRLNMAIRLAASFAANLEWKREIGWLASTRREFWLEERMEQLDREIDAVNDEYYLF